MPIKDLQQRLRQIGEIRIGHVVDTGRLTKDGKPIKRPAKLSKFRFTSPSKVILDSVAALYGGNVQPWTPANGGTPEWELYSTVDRLPILVPPRDAVSQWYELYAGSRCMRRCDGEIEQKSDKPCMCNPEKRQCSITTRVNVMLQDVPALGQWLLVSKGYNSAVTLPGAAEILAQVGAYVPGWLGMEEKVVLKDDGPPNRFMVPTIDVDVSPRELMSGELTAAGKAAVEAPKRAAIAAAPAPAAARQAPAAGPSKNFEKLASAAKTVAEVDALIKEAKAEGAPDSYLATLTSIGAALAKDDGGLTERLLNPGDYGPTSEAEIQEIEGAIFTAALAEETVDAEIVEDASTDDIADVYFEIVKEAGRLGWTTSRIDQEFVDRNGRPPGSAPITLLREFLAFVKSGGAR